LVVSETIDTAADTAGQRKNAVFKRIPICPPAHRKLPANPSRFNDLARRPGRDAVEASTIPSTLLVILAMGVISEPHILRGEDSATCREASVHMDAAHGIGKKIARSPVIDALIAPENNPAVAVPNLIARPLTVKSFRKNAPGYLSHDLPKHRAVGISQKRCPRLGPLSGGNADSLCLL
jgi:hypothetical protein